MVPHQQRALGPQQFAVGGSQLPARCGQLDRGRTELYPSGARAKKGWQGVRVVAEYPTAGALQAPRLPSLVGQKWGASRPETHTHTTICSGKES